ncbi:MAG: TIGR04211 family SH3 domain-containing protein [Panacagrimonas sp.]
MRSKIHRWVLLSVLLSAPFYAKGAGPSVRYISDDTSITLRQDKSLDAPVSGLISSGTRVELIETDTASGYARVRVAAGREGWVLSRYLSLEPSARERLAKVEAQLVEQREAARVLSEDNERLRAEVGDPASGSAASPGQRGASGGILTTADKRPGEAATMITGAGLFIVGLLAGLLIPHIPFLPRSGRRGFFGRPE